MFSDSIIFHQHESVPEASKAIEVLSGRPVKERLYGPNVWLRKYRYCVPGKIQKQNAECQLVNTYRGYTTLELNDKQKNEFKAGVLFLWDINTSRISLRNFCEIN